MTETSREHRLDCARLQSRSVEYSVPFTNAVGYNVTTAAKKMMAMELTPDDDHWRGDSGGDSTLVAVAVDFDAMTTTTTDIPLPVHHKDAAQCILEYDDVDATSNIEETRRKKIIGEEEDEQFSFISLNSAGPSTDTADLSNGPIAFEEPEEPSAVSAVSTMVMDEEYGIEEMALLCTDFNATCRLAGRLGVAAIRYGSMVEAVERFLPKLMEVYGYRGHFVCNTTTLSCNFEQGHGDETVIRLQNLPVEADFQLTKLGLLSDLAKDLIECRVSILEANKRLDEIEKTEDPWGTKAKGMALLAAGAALPSLLSGCWWDMLVGTVAAGLTFVLTLLFDRLPSRLHVWMDLTASFCCSTLGFAVKVLSKPGIDATIVTLSGIVILMPSSTITLGINDIVSRHVTSGFERLSKGLIELMWLVLGFWLGMSLVDSVVEDLDLTTEKEVQSKPIPRIWQALFIPLLCAGVAVALQMSGRDMFWGILCMFVAYGSSLVCVVFLNEQQYLGSFIASLTMTLFANTWSRWFDRPNTIILFPAFQLVVAGIVGFLGLTGMVANGDTKEGKEQLLHMFFVAGIVVAGVMAGGTLVQPYTTI